MTSKRSLLRGAAALFAAPAAEAAASEAAPAETTAAPAADGRTPRWGMVIDLRKCIGCQACTVACSLENGVPPDQHRTYVPTYEVDGPRGPLQAPLPRLCNHCEDPPCLPVCPVDATFKRADGTVLVDADRCVGCGYCVQACPYGARFLNERTGTADKCSFCIQRVDAGLLPACVETCVGGARVFGDLNDPESAVSQLLAENRTQVLKPEAGTGPQVRYIGLDDALAGEVELQEGARSLRELAGLPAPADPARAPAHAPGEA